MTDGRRATLLFAAGVVALCVVAGALMLSFGDVTQDDAFISYRYARNLAEGRGLVYNAGERVEGYSNFLWTITVAAGAKAGLPPPVTGRWLGMACALAAVVATALLARRLAGPWLGLVAAAMLAVNASFLVNGAQGLETALFVLLVTLGAYLAGEEFADLGRRPWSAVPLILAMLTRADGALVWLVALPFYVVTVKDNRRRFILWAGSFLLVAAAFEAWRLAYYGNPFPNTFYVKAMPGGGPWRTGLPYAGTFLLRFTPILLFLPLAARRRKPLYLWAALVVAFFAYVTAVGGDMLPTDRLYLPVVPLLVIAAAAALGDLVARADIRPWARAVLAAALVATPLLGFYPSFDYARAYRLPRQFHVAAGKWLGANAPPGATLATTAAGIVPYYSGLRTYDMLGLTDRYVARHGSRHATLPGHGLAAAAYILRAKPTYVLVYDMVFSPLPLTAEDVAAGAGSPAARELVAAPAFRRAYVLSRAEIAPGEYFYYFIRNDYTGGANSPR